MKTHDDDDMELLLGRLTPAAPRAEFLERLRETPLSEPKKILPFRPWLPLAAAAGLALALGLYFHKPSAAKSLAGDTSPPIGTQSQLVPLKTLEHLMKVTDLGVVQDRDQRPVRLIGTTWVDETLYKSMPDGKRVSQSRLRQEVLPVSLQTY